MLVLINKYIIVFSRCFILQLALINNYSYYNQGYSIDILHINQGQAFLYTTYNCQQIAVQYNHLC